MPELVLGTVQLGLDYGINNKSGKINSKESFEILNKAYQENIRILDTAYIYGDSEKIIGSYINRTGNEFKICSKLPSKNKYDYEDAEKLLKNSLKKLNKEKIEYYFLHNANDITNNSIINQIKKLKEKNLINNLGVSVYTPAEVRNVLNSKVDFDVIQLPLNIFDRRLIKGGLLKKLKEKEISTFIRSIFLQGLLFVDPEKLPLKLREAKPYLKKINEFASNNNEELASLIFSWYYKNNYGDYILMGVDNKKQLNENLEVIKKGLPKNIENKFEELVESINIPDSSLIIDPRKW